MKIEPGMHVRDKTYGRLFLVTRSETVLRSGKTYISLAGFGAGHDANQFKPVVRVKMGRRRV